LRDPTAKRLGAQCRYAVGEWRRIGYASRMSETNILHTARLTLTPPVLADFEGSAALWAEPEVVRYISGKPSTRAESWGRFQRQAGAWPLLGYGAWTVRERATGRYVGEIGFGNFKREMEPGFGDAPEAGWVLAPWAHGQGFATEAVTAAHAWGDARFRGERTVCMIDPANAASLGVAAKLGYMEFARTRFLDSEVVLLERPLPRG
jgi:RimJ/RimL family protein N-acetyltransferase